MVVRWHAETSPLLFVERFSQLIAPGKAQVFGPPDTALLPGYEITHDLERAVLWEYYGRFTVRNLRTGATFQPEPPELQFHQLTPAMPVPGGVVYNVFMGYYSGVWLWTEEGGSRALMHDAGVSRDFAVVEGNRLAWAESSGPLGPLRYEHVALWTGLLEEGSVVGRRKLLDLEQNVVPTLTLGQNRLVARLNGQEVAILDVASPGHKRKLTLPEGRAVVTGTGARVMTRTHFWFVEVTVAGKRMRLARVPWEAIPEVTP